jgi:hypothetical protein
LVQVTLVTPTLSLAVPRRLIVLLLVLYVEPVVGEVMLMLGAVVSGGVYVTVSVAGVWFPAASYAVTVITLAPLAKLMLLAVHEVVPLAVPFALVS